MKRIMNSLAKKALVLFFATAFIVSGVNAMSTTEPEYDGWVKDILALRKKELVKLGSVLDSEILKNEDSCAFHEKVSTTRKVVVDIFSNETGWEHSKFHRQTADEHRTNASRLKSVLDLVKPVIKELNTSIEALKKAKPGSDESSFLSQKSLSELITAFKKIKEEYSEEVIPVSRAIYALTKATPLAPSKRPATPDVTPDYHGWVRDILVRRKFMLVKLSSALTDISRELEETLRLSVEFSERWDLANKKDCFLEEVLNLAKTVIIELETSIKDLEKAKNDQANHGSDNPLFLSQKSLGKLITALNKTEEKYPEITVSHAIHALEQKTPLPLSKRPSK